MYMTRSIHEEENEQVVNETIERYGVEWELQRVLPDVYTEAMDAETKSNCFSIFPSESNGNGVFLAHFALKKAPTLETQEDPVIDSSETLNNEENNVTTKERKPRLSKSIGKSKPLDALVKIKKLPKHVIRSIERLSIPRISVEGIPQILKNIKSDEIKDNDLREKILVDSFSSLKMGKSMTLTDENTKNTDEIDIAIFGISLKKFYSPRTEALKVMEQENVWLRQKFPVPNPRPWK